MLQGIANISTNTEHSEVKKDFKLYGKQRSLLNDDSSNDHIQISPAFQYLTKLNWKLQKIDVNDKDKIVINFTIFEYLFKITIDLKLLPHLNKVFFDVKKKIENKNIVLLFSVPFILKENETLENLALDNLNVLYTRLYYMVRTREIGSAENKVTYGFYEDIIPGLKIEFQKILYALIIFAEKLTSQKILERVNFTRRNANPETIRLENVEVC